MCISGMKIDRSKAAVYCFPCEVDCELLYTLFGRVYQQLLPNVLPVPGIPITMKKALLHTNLRAQKL